MITTLHTETKDIYEVQNFLVFQSFNLFDNFCRKLVAFFFRITYQNETAMSTKKELIESFL